jgi:hypothetical protein
VGVKYMANLELKDVDMVEIRRFKPKEWSINIYQNGCVMPYLMTLNGCEENDRITLKIKEN